MTRVSGGGVAAWLKPGRSGERLSPLDAPSSLILRLTTLLARRYNRDYDTALGLNSAEVRLITLLHEKGPLPFRQIVERSLMDKAQVSRTLPGLIERGSVEIAGHSPASRRFSATNTATLTVEGRRLFERVRIIARRHQLELLRPLSPAERRMLHAVLHRLIDGIEGN